jgi:hypothetical protein
MPLNSEQVEVSDRYCIDWWYCSNSYLIDDGGDEKIAIVSTNSSANDDYGPPLVCYWSNNYSINDGGYAYRQPTMMGVTMKNGRAMMMVTRIDNQQ